MAATVFQVLSPKCQSDIYLSNGHSRSMSLSRLEFKKLSGLRTEVNWPQAGCSNVSIKIWAIDYSTGRSSTFPKLLMSAIIGGLP